jgi:hypothetical protein
MRMDRSTEENLEVLAKLTGVSKTKAVKEAIKLNLKQAINGR